MQLVVRDKKAPGQQPAPQQTSGIWVDGMQARRIFIIKPGSLGKLVDDGSVATKIEEVRVIRRSGKGSGKRPHVFFLLADLERELERKEGTEPVGAGEMENAMRSLERFPFGEKLAPQIQEALRRTSDDAKVRSEFCTTHLPRIVEALVSAFPDSVEPAFSCVVSFKKLEQRGIVPVPKNRSWPAMAREIEECCLAMGRNGWAEIGIRLGDNGFVPQALGGEIMAWEKEYHLAGGGTALAKVHRRLPYAVALFASGRPCDVTDLELGESAKSEIKNAESTCEKHTPNLSEFNRNLTYRLGNGN